ncbi:MAG: polyphosphate polymerase domain-containing protein [Lachnospiraceae bacterium]|nr:polyphosphate polymerase domain-containing protein [Lachnospiraceae bacterium]
MYRVEDKFSCSKMEMFLLKTRLQSVLEIDSNQKNKDGYQITSVYFDDYWDSCLRETIDGVRNRCKYRIRIYDDNYDAIKLEIKYKSDSKINKLSQNITFEEMKTFLKGECVERECETDDVIGRMNMAIRTKKLEPVVIVEYDRTAFVYETGNVRITLDRNLRYSTNIDDFVNGKKEQYRILPEDNRVIEVKYDEMLPGVIARIIENGNMIQTSYSKYSLCRGMELGYVNERCY